MSSTRNALKALGSQSMNEEALIEAGKNTLRDKIAQTLRESGITEAVSFDVVLKNGETFNIASEANPRMATPAAEVSSVRPRQSARAGYDEQVKDWSALLG